MRGWFLCLPTSTLFFPIQANAFIVSLGFPHSALLPGLVTSWAVVALSPWPSACSAFHAACDMAILKDLLCGITLEILVKCETGREHCISCAEQFDIYPRDPTYLPFLTTSLFPIPSSLIYTHLPHHSYAARTPALVLTCIDLLDGGVLSRCTRRDDEM
jgi:hypothetical protein